MHKQFASNCLPRMRLCWKYKPRPRLLPNEKMSAEPPKLKDLVDDLHDVASKWRAIGVQLEVHQPTLKAIDYEHRGDCNQAFSDMLDRWINNGPNVSWQTVVDALNACSVGEKALALDIQKRRLGISSKYGKFTQYAKLSVSSCEASTVLLKRKCVCHF